MKKLLTIILALALPASVLAWDSDPDPFPDYFNGSAITDSFNDIYDNAQEKIAGTDGQLLQYNGTTLEATSSLNGVGKITGLVGTLTYATDHTLTESEASGQMTIATATMTLTLPTAVAGYSGCFLAGQGVTEVIQLEPASGDYLVVDGVRGTAATAYASDGSAGDSICFVAANDTDWYITSKVGTWSE